MNYEYIEQLLERYWQSETTIEEERILRAFFNQAELPDHLSRYAPLFALQQQERSQTLPADFDQRMMQIVGQTETVEAKKIKLSVRFAPLFKAAAAVAIVLTIGNVTERALRDSAAADATTIDTYQRKEDITATIKIIDQNRSATIARGDSATHHTAPVVFDTMDDEPADE